MRCKKDCEECKGLGYVVQRDERGLRRFVCSIAAQRAAQEKVNTPSIAYDSDLCVVRAIFDASTSTDEHKRSAARQANRDGLAATGRYTLRDVLSTCRVLGCCAYVFTEKNGKPLYFIDVDGKRSPLPEGPYTRR